MYELFDILVLKQGYLKCELQLIGEIIIYRHFNLWDSVNHILKKQKK